METQTLAAEQRSTKGKGAARQLRAAGRIPAVFYGPGAEAASLSVSPKDLGRVLSTEWRRNVLINVEFGGTARLAMVKELQLHPVTREPLHVDLYAVSLDRQVAARVPFSVKGRAKGVVGGGELNVIFRDLPVRATPDKLPAEIVVDVTPLDLGDALKVKDLAPGEGVTVTLDPERNVVAVVSPRRRQAAEGEEGAAAPAG
jgi:large subunit ribosomal protein L25